MTIKNSASNPITTQALRCHAAQLLPMVSLKIHQLGYQKLSHLRLSQHQAIDGDLNIYQALSRAQHPIFGEVMIKWQLMMTVAISADSSLADKSSIIGSLNYESDILKGLKGSNCVPPLLATADLHVLIDKKKHPLTVVVMPFYSAGDLAVCLGQQFVNHKISLAQKHHLIIQSAQLIADFHGFGWCHGDIKPSNILLKAALLLENHPSFSKPTMCPTVLLIDFALAQPFETDCQIYHKTILTNNAGTPAYLAPEVWQGHSVSVQRDVYAFGIMMYQILVGTRPFAIAPNAHNFLQAWALVHCQQPIPTLPKAYQSYQSIINKILAKRMATRYQNMDEVLEDLQDTSCLCSWA